VRLIRAAACLIAAVANASGAGQAAAQQAPPPAAVSPEATFLAQNRKAPGVIETASGVQYRVMVPAAGAHPTDTDAVLVNYEARLADGTTFDKSLQPTPMPVAGVVPGFAEALKLMSKGEKLRVWIPSRLAYGAEEQRDPQGKVVIPANSIAVFDVELIDFLPMTVIEEYQRKMQDPANAGGPAPQPGK
jgi:FKBP-type peptidyl-prolyl cis-trans isomerase